MMEITINNEMVECAEGETILEVCRRFCLDIPTLCYHDAIKPLGICGLCVVAVASEDDPDKKKYMRACITKVKDGMIVETIDDEIFKKRGEVIKKYLAYAPGDLDILMLADIYDVDPDAVEPVKDSGDCIMCGLCVRTCTEIIGLEWPWKKGKEFPRDTAPPKDCIGCLACANVCPTGCIEFSITDEKRTIWGQDFELVKCEECGAPGIPKAQRDWLVKRDNVPADYFNLCDACKRNKIAGVQAEISKY